MRLVDMTARLFRVGGVDILTNKGAIRGVTGKRAIHLMSPEERRKVPEMHRMWIDIGAKDRDEALERVQIGDAAVYDHGLSHCMDLWPYQELLMTKLVHIP